jgi:hypothetical protein
LLKGETRYVQGGCGVQCGAAQLFWWQASFHCNRVYLDTKNCDACPLLVLFCIARDTEVVGDSVVNLIEGTRGVERRRRPSNCDEVV